jgi:hypothetical protein
MDYEAIEREIRKQLADEQTQVTEDDIQIEHIEPNEFPQEVRDPLTEPVIITRTYTEYPFLKEFSTEDFNLLSDTKIDLKRTKLNDEGKDMIVNNGYYLILFMDESSVSKQYFKRILDLSTITRETKGKLAYCNVFFEKKIMKAFQDLNEIKHIHHPFYWARYIETPFLMIYKEHWPQGFYNGNMRLDDLMSYVRDELSNPLSQVDQRHILRKDISMAISKVERKFDLEEEKQKLHEKQEQQRIELKKLDTKRQMVAEGVNFMKE